MNCHWGTLAWRRAITATSPRPFRRYPRPRGAQGDHCGAFGRSQRKGAGALAERNAAHGAPHQRVRTHRHGGLSARWTTSSAANLWRTRWGQTFSGVISGVSEFALFVQLPSTVEGAIRLSALEDDYYIFDDKLYRIVGRNRRHGIRAGRSYRGARSRGGSGAAPRGVCAQRCARPRTILPAKAPAATAGKSSKRTCSVVE